MKIKNILLTIAITASLQVEMRAQAQFINYNTPSSAEGKYSVQNLSVLNSDQLDYAAIPYKNGVVFTSTRGEGGLLSCSSDLPVGNYSDIYFAEKGQNGQFEAPLPLRSNMNTKYHDGVVSFNRVGDLMFFSRNNEKGINKNGRINLKIYAAKLSGQDNWNNFYEMKFNGDDFSTCHPALSPDGNVLYFASDRPGGYGGMDIYKVEKTGDGWTEPINMGKPINTSGNELFPFVDHQNHLFFASNGHQGLGNLDIFSVATNDEWMNESTTIEHLAAPINSAYDDFAFTADATGKSGFLTSNRVGGNGEDDVYHWSFDGLLSVPIKLCVIDANDDSRIEDAKLSIAPIGAEQNNTNGTQAVAFVPVEINGQTYLAFPANQLENGANVSQPLGFVPAKSCAVNYKVAPGKQYQITVSKTGYAPLTKTVSAEALAKMPEFLVPIQPLEQKRTISGTVSNILNDHKLPLSTVKLFNKCTGETTEFTTDHHGYFEFEADCNCDYRLVGLKDNFEYAEVVLEAAKRNCSQLVTKTNIALSPKPLRKPETKPTGVFEAEKINVGAVIRLDKLYYDFNRARIRSDAAVELDKVVKLLRQYPSMEIELGSHTDARGSDDYNEDLSRRRAERAVEYIISRGISSSRIKAKGYGEYELTNQCANGVKCTDEEHQANRRTEIKITKFEEKGVRVED